MTDMGFRHTESPDHSRLIGYISSSSNLVSSWDDKHILSAPKMAEIICVLRIGTNLGFASDSSLLKTRHFQKLVESVSEHRPYDRFWHVALIVYVACL